MAKQKILARIPFQKRLVLGLKATGIADVIFNLAFGLTLGAVAVALSFDFWRSRSSWSADEILDWQAS
jgi:hypothetical protein